MRRVGALVLLVLGLLAAAVDAAPRWGWLGVRVRDLSEQEVEEISKSLGLREGFGAVIVDVIKEAPAEASGLRPATSSSRFAAGPSSTRAPCSALSRRRASARPCP